MDIVPPDEKRSKVRILGQTQRGIYPPESSGRRVIAAGQSGESSEITSFPLKKSGKGRKMIKEDVAPLGIISSTQPLKPRRRYWWYGAVIVGFLLIALAISLVAIKPVRLIITPRVDEIKEEIRVDGLTSVTTRDLREKVIPLEVLEASKTLSQEFPATGEEERELKALGEITVVNFFSSAPQILVRTTRFETADGKVFRSTQSVTVPGTTLKEGKVIPGEIRVGVMADKPGPDYNIEPTTFHLPGFKGGAKYEKIIARSEKPFHGGAKGKVKIVTASDISSATDRLKIKMTEELSREVRSKMLPGFSLLDGGMELRVDSIETLPPTGEAADAVRVQLKGRLLALVFRSDDLREVIERFILDSFSEPRRVLNSQDSFTSEIESTDFSKGMLALNILVNARAETIVDGELLAQKLTGKSEEEVIDLLRKDPAVGKAKIIFWPPWISTFPQDSKDIKVSIKEP